MLIFEDSTINGVTKGAFNGRFAFHAPDICESVCESFIEIENGKIPNNEIIQHEFTHKLLLDLSSCMRILNFMRIVARISHMVFKSKSLVSSYYRLRSYYYLLTAEIHEKITHDALDELKAIRSQSKNEPMDGALERYANWVKSTFRERVRELDNQVQCKWQDIYPLPVLLALKYISYIWNIYYLIGNVGYAAFVYSGDKEIVREGKFTSSYILKHLRIEVLFKNSLRSDMQWLLVKMQEEEACMKRLSGQLKWPRKRYQAIYDQRARLFEFICRWSNISEQNESEVADKYLDLFISPNHKSIIDTDVGLDERVERFIAKYSYDPKVKKLINFYYLHGN